MSCTCMYCSLMKECPWAEHLTSLPKQGAGTLTSNHERMSMSHLQQFDAFKANNWTKIMYSTQFYELLCHSDPWYSLGCVSH